MVWYSYLLQSFPQFIVIHTVEGFGIVSKAEIDVFLELSWFFNDLADISNFISSSSAFSKTSLNIWKFLVNVLLKPGLENFEHYSSNTEVCSAMFRRIFKGGVVRCLDEMTVVQRREFSFQRGVSPLGDISFLDNSQSITYESIPPRPIFLNSSFVYLQLCAQGTDPNTLLYARTYLHFPLCILNCSAFLAVLNCMFPSVCMLSYFSHVQLFVTYGLRPSRLLCPWDTPGNIPGVGCHALLQGIFLSQELNQGILCLS